MSELTDDDLAALDEMPAPFSTYYCLALLSDLRAARARETALREALETVLACPSWQGCPTHGWQARAALAARDGERERT